MVFKRSFGEGGDGDFGLPNKRRHFLSTIFKGVSSSRTLQDYVPRLEPIIRKWVKEEVNHVFGPFLRASDSQTESSRSRTLQLRFLSNLPHTIFTGNRIVCEDTSAIKFALFDSTSDKIVTLSPYSSMKVDVIVLEGDFVPDCLEDWSKKDFDSKIVKNREGKRPLLTGELMVSLQDGVGCIGDVSFTDNSRWIRSGKFRLAVKVRSGFEETSVREGISNAFKVKDHRGESYQKHYPPLLDDEVWRLEKMAKDGPSHKQLRHNGIFCVRDFLKSYATNQPALRTVLGNVSNKKWDAIVRHAKTCALDNKKYVYRTAQGTGLLFNSIYQVVGVAFDGQIHHPADTLNNYEMRMVEDLKQEAYRNLHNWEECEAAGPSIGPQNTYLHVGQGQLELQMNAHHPTISLPHNLGESSSMQGFDRTFSNSFGVSGSPDTFYIGEQSWASGSNHTESQLPPQDFTSNNNNFEVESSALIGDSLFLFPAIMN